MLWTQAHSGLAYRALSTVLAFMMVFMLAAPSVVVFADEATSTPTPETVVEEIPVDVPDSATEGDMTEAESVEVLFDERAVESVSEPAVEEAAPVEETSEPAVEGEAVAHSDEVGSVTVAPLGFVVLANGGGPRDDFPPPITVGEGCELTTIATFWAGQHTDAGSVSVYNDSDTLYVTFQTTGGWTMGLTHLYVGLTPPASYAPGSFPYQTPHNPAVTSYTYEIPLADIGASAGDTIYIAAHAEVSNGQQNETAWAGQGQWPGLLFSHTVQECEEPVPADITVVKFNDLNENGVLDEGEPYIEGVEITIDAEGYSDSANTDTSGTVVFSDLDAGSYSIDEVLPQGWFATVSLPLVVELAEGQDQTVYIGNAEEELPFTFIDLSIVKAADVETATAGDIITYTLEYRNLGSTEAFDFTITDDFDETLVEIVDSAGGTVADGMIVWSLAGPLAPEDGVQTITYTARVLDPVPAQGARIDNVVVIFHPLDDNPENDTDDATVSAEPFLPFTPQPDPDQPIPTPVAQPTTSPDPEPYLPYTGGDLWILALVGGLAVIAGAGLRLAGSKS